MEEAILFWNALNLTVILGGVIAVGILLGSVIHIVISMLTQVDDSAVGFFAKLSGGLLSCYLFSGFLLSSISEFSSRLWFEGDIFK